MLPPFATLGVCLFGHHDSGERRQALPLRH